MKNNSPASALVSQSLPVSLNLLESIVGLTPSATTARRRKKRVAEVVFEIEFLKVLTDRAVGKIWFLGTQENEEAVQGEGFILMPIRPDATGNGFTIRGGKAPVVADRFGECGNLMEVVRGLLAIDSLSADDTKIRTGFGRMTITEAPPTTETVSLSFTGTEKIAFIN